MRSFKCGQRVVSAFGRGVVSPAARRPGGSDDPAVAARRRRLREVLWRLRRALAAAAGSGFQEEIHNLLRGLGEGARDLKAALIAWVKLIEELVQEVESHEGKGGGAEKKEQVKAALLRLLVEVSLKDGRTPNFFEPLLFEAAADWSIDSVVWLVKRHDRWQQPAPEPGLFQRLLRPVAAAADAFGRRLNVALARLVLRRVLARHPVSPVMAAKLKEVGATTTLLVGELITDSLSVVDWIDDHRKQVVATVEVVATVVEEAERLIELPGSEKQAYARDLIIVFLQEDGFFPAQGSLLAPFFERGIELMIDAVVDLFHHWDLFQHRGA